MDRISKEEAHITPNPNPNPSCSRNRNHNRNRNRSHSHSPNPNPSQRCSSPSPSPNPNPSCSRSPNPNPVPSHSCSPNPNPNPNCSRKPKPNPNPDRHRRSRWDSGCDEGRVAARSCRKAKWIRLVEEEEEEEGADLCQNPNPNRNPNRNPNPNSNPDQNPNINPNRNPNPNPNQNPNQNPNPGEGENLVDLLAQELVVKIFGGLGWTDLWNCSRVCWPWYRALAPLREGMHLLHWGKKFKHGRGGVSRNPDKALHSFLKGAARGSSAAMVDAGLLLWELGRKQDGIKLYMQAAELGDPAGQCNLGLAYLEDSSFSVEAVKCFQKAALAGNVRAQYSLAICLQHGRGVKPDIVQAAQWYLRAAKGGSARGMYNVALCYQQGDGIPRNVKEARRWMKCAALGGHQKAMFEHGLTLFSEGDGGLALMFLELATRAGETEAAHVRCPTSSAFTSIASICTCLCSQVGTSTQITFLKLGFTLLNIYNVVVVPISKLDDVKSI